MMGMINEAKEGLKTHCVIMMQLGKKNVSVQQKRQLNFRLMTILIQKQAKHHPNQQHHLIKHPHIQLNTILIIKKNSLKKRMLDHGHQKKKF